MAINFSLLTRYTEIYGTRKGTIQNFWVSGHVVGGATEKNPLVSEIMVNGFHVVSVHSPHCLFATLEHTLRIFL